MSKRDRTGQHGLISVLVSYVFVLLFIVRLSQAEQVANLNYCPYFNNRAPSPQPNLRNCTWYKENACCLPHELDSILEAIAPLTGANNRCLRAFNYLMCYVCAPYQNMFYKNERLTVCRDFCDTIFQSCGDAFLKGSRISSAYKSGEEFCESRKFIVADGKSKNCFTSIQSISGAVGVKIRLLTVVVTIAIGFVCW
ncbi:predicted protein [Nematostella vectensis]|uniref:Folate receptor-like domain-containing protein n=1 Tax=Nematostella vectensis TaxID=45351 RepID=A7T9S3_NEMVE|nr:predicted protein [Nematostella vectensis]|eukprot:XP_001619350.1 hypothetical protein NEMVEDRAFT_v1g224272 [Nematostella vectensis]